MIRTLILWITLAVVAEAVAWAVQVQAAACCNPSPATDPDADVRASNFSGLLIFGGTFTGIWLNGILIVLFYRFAVGEQNSAAHVIADVGRAITIGASVISIPIGFAAIRRNRPVEGLLYALFALSPLIVAAFMILLRRRQNGIRPL